MNVILFSILYFCLFTWFSIKMLAFFRRLSFCIYFTFCFTFFLFHIFIYLPLLFFSSPKVYFLFTCSWYSWNFPFLYLINFFWRQKMKKLISILSSHNFSTAFDSIQFSHNTYTHLNIAFLWKHTCRKHKPQPSWFSFTFFTYFKDFWPFHVDFFFIKKQTVFLSMFSHSIIEH